MEERLVLRRRFRNTECRELIMHERRLRRLQRRQERDRREREAKAIEQAKALAEQAEASVPEDWIKAWAEINKANSITATVSKWGYVPEPTWSVPTGSVVIGGYVSTTGTTTTAPLAQPITFGNLQSIGSGTISGYYSMDVI